MDGRDVFSLFVTAVGFVGGFLTPFLPPCAFLLLALTPLVLFTSRRAGFFILFLCFASCGYLRGRANCSGLEGYAELPRRFRCRFRGTVASVRVSGPLSLLELEDVSLQVVGEREIRFFPGGVRLTLYGDPVERGWRKGALVAGLGRGKKTVIGGGMKDLRKMAEGVLVEITPARGFFFLWGGEGPVSFREKMVQRVRTRLKEEKFPEAVAWFLGCLLTGRRAGGADVSKVLRETGLSHLLAVSGLHVGVAAAVTGSIARLLLVLLSRATGRYFFAVPISFACGLISAFFLVFIHSFPPSAVRALTGFAFASAFSFNRCRVRDVVVDGLVFAFFCLLISHPEALFSPSFILSFSVTGGILLHVHSFGRKGRWNLSGTVGIPVAAYLFSLPLVSFLFRSVSPLSFIFNLIFVPLMLPLLSLSLVWEVFFFLGLDLPLLGLVSPLLNGLIGVLMRISEIPGIFVKVTEPPRPVWIVLYSSSLVLIYLSVLSWGLREGGKTRL